MGLIIKKTLTDLNGMTIPAGTFIDYSLKIAATRNGNRKMAVNLIPYVSQSVADSGGQAYIPKEIGVANLNFDVTLSEGDQVNFSFEAVDIMVKTHLQNIEAIGANVEIIK